MSQRPNLTVRDGSGGGGKTFHFVLWLIREFLPYETARIITNVPLHVEAVVDWALKCGSRKAKLDRQTLIDRIHIIPQEVWLSWSRDVEAGGSTPLGYFGHSYDFAGSHIAIDEAHRLIGPEKSEAHQAEWRAFAGELRHQHGTLELISQAFDKLSASVTKECSFVLNHITDEQRRDVWFQIPWGDWHEIYAGFVSGRYIPGFWCIEKVRTGNRWNENGQESFAWFNPAVKNLYDSYATVDDDGTVHQGSGGPERMFQRLTRWELFCWFCGRNWGKLPRVVGMTLFLSSPFTLAGGCVYLNVRQHRASVVRAAEREAKLKPVAAVVGPAAAAGGVHDKLVAVVPQTVRKVCHGFSSKVAIINGEVVGLGEAVAGDMLAEIDVASHRVRLRDAGWLPVEALVIRGTTGAAAMGNTLSAGRSGLSGGVAGGQPSFGTFGNTGRAGGGPDGVRSSAQSGNRADSDSGFGGGTASGVVPGGQAPVVGADLGGGSVGGRTGP